MNGQEAAYADQISDTVFVVDDDPLVLKSLYATLSLAGFRVVKFASAELFLENITSRHSGCVITDIRMPGMNGLELQEELARRNGLLSVIVMSGHADVPLAVRAIKAGALEILQKPFGHDQLVSHVRTALALSQVRVSQFSTSEAASQRLQSLTEREREVFDLVVQGRANKEIARSLDISFRTVEVHRARIMAKFDVGSIAELVLAAQAAAGQSPR